MPGRGPITPPLRIGLVGCGLIGGLYRDALDESDRAVLAGACDVDARKAASPAWRGVPFFTDHAALIDAVAPDALIVCVPNDRHATVCSDILDRGASLCCEKPLTLTYRDALALAAKAAVRGALLFTAFHRRYNRNLIAAMRSIGSDDPIVAVQAIYQERIEDHCGGDSWYLEPARVGGGCLADNGPNVVDTVAALLGAVEPVACRIERDRRGIDIRAEIELRARTGARGHCRLDWAYARGERKDLTLRLQSGRTIVVDFLAGYPQFKSSLEHEYCGILDAFLDALAGLRDAQAPPLHAPDGVEAARIVERCYAIAEEVERVEMCGLVC